MELGKWGWRECEWKSSDLVRQWQGFLDSPERFLRHLLQP